MSDQDYQEIRRRIEKRYDNRSGFYIHLAVFLIVNLGIWIAWLFTDPLARMNPVLPLLVTLGWGAGFIAHMIDFIMAEARENAIEKAIERERGWLMEDADARKRKRGAARLSSDGEILDIIEDDWEDDSARQRR